jgi:hypothetical protein
MVYECKWFKLHELISPAIYAHFGVFAWRFLDEGMKKDADLLRELWGKPLIINNYFWGGSYKESGLRCNTDLIVRSKKTPYLSAHVLGRAFDIKPENIKDVPELYKCIQLNYHKFQAISRMENIKYAISWVHIDNLGERKNCIEIFNI